MNDGAANREKHTYDGGALDVDVDIDDDTGVVLAGVVVGDEALTFEVVAIEALVDSA